MKNRIRVIRKSTNLTQAEFGERICATRAMIASYESGAVIPSDPILKLISKEFNVSYSWLKTGEHETEDFIMKEQSSSWSAETTLSLPDQLRLLADALEEMGPEWNKKLEKAIKRLDRKQIKQTDC